MNEEQQWRARRAFIRAHHPDRGGDAAVFIAGLARLDHAGPPEVFDRVRVIVVRRRPLVVRLIQALSRRCRRLARVC
ncbi:hypothetical protein Drose_16085 [Dactylosporangium roseum]|uniref:J domain-containing protein n=1 Tax=Dactylosporangium roseum TaxID=47989 RepID=A0ABY5ZBW4_9ACTN|nr:hypothetical protein [Dactylosporangium roseum]UWZ39606.1 hypothetical protein Drose_16085 [Dactylosporangium roseum]